MNPEIKRLIWLAIDAGFVWGQREAAHSICCYPFDSDRLDRCEGLAVGYMFRALELVEEEFERGQQSYLDRFKITRQTIVNAGFGPSERVHLDEIFADKEGEDQPQPPTRRRLPPECPGHTQRVEIGNVKLYITTENYPDGTLGAVSMRLAKEGKELRVYNTFAKAISIGLQHGIPLKEYIEEFKGIQMEPSGITSDPVIPIAKSIPDYLVRWLEIKYLSDKTKH